MLTRILLAAMLLCLQLRPQAGEAKESISVPFDGQADAPEFPTDVEWLNTKSPLTLKDLKGKVVLLDFWTYCCINCMHIIPDLKKLETKYKNELVVIGVHSAKFDNEKQTQNIREAIKRYEIEHPVVNDKDFKVWRSYGVHSWPSLMLLNPNGRIIGSHSGEGIYDLFDEVIGQTIKHFDEKGQIDRREIRFDLESSSTPPSLLAYPGKIHGDGPSNRIVFSDSNHNRIVLATTEGDILEVIGQGERSLEDGSFEKAKFFRPQGVFLDAPHDRIYVADTENHAIRLIDLKARTVRTLVGTGQHGGRYQEAGHAVLLNSPWDVVLTGDTLFIAMAGSHTLWSLDTKTLTAVAHAGTGYENLKDGRLLGCALAQPSGITSDGKKLYFADSEVSAVRFADLRIDGEVGTIIGQGLFEFGDLDGTYPGARLQHPLGITWHDGALYVADTYNHKIKQVDVAKKSVKTFLGTGKRGYADGPGDKAEFNEPSGLCVIGNKMFIADANNSLIRVCDLSSKTVSTLSWKHMEKLAPAAKPNEVAKAEELPLQSISTSTRELVLKLNLPAGKKINPLAHSTISFEPPSTNFVQCSTNEIEIREAAVALPVSFKTGKGNLVANLDLYYCDEQSAGLCYFVTKRIAIPIQAGPDGEAKLEVAYKVGR